MEIQFAINAVFPIVLLVALGYILKKVGLINAEFAKMANKVVFRVCLPAMLFLNVYSIKSFSEIDLTYVLIGVAVVISVFALGIVIAMLVTKDPKRRGPLLQASFRSNFALVGLPLVAIISGNDDSAVAAILAAFAIPLFNILAVTALSIFKEGGEDEDSGGYLKKVNGVLLSIIKNPLIIAVSLGFVFLFTRPYAEAVGIFIGEDGNLAFIYKALEYLKSSATPLALLALGAQFEFLDIKSMWHEILAGVVVRNFVTVLLGMAVVVLFFRDSFSKEQIAALFALWVTPVAVSSVPMSQEMHADSALAGQLVVWTTVVSGFTVFIGTLLLKTFSLI